MSRFRFGLRDAPPRRRLAERGNGRGRGGGRGGSGAGSGLRAVVMKRFPRDWAVYVDMYGDGFVKAEGGVVVGTRDGGGAEEEGRRGDSRRRSGSRAGCSLTWRGFRGDETCNHCKVYV